MKNGAEAFQKLPGLRSLQAFEAVARTGSVSAAADELGVSPGAISQQLRKIEEQLGLLLLERTGKGVQLTRWGKTYYAQVAMGFDQLRRAQQVLWRARTQRGLVVSCLSSVASKWLGPQLFEWQQKFSTAKLLLVGAESEPDLEDGETDFRISYGALATRYAHHAELFTDCVVPTCAPSLLVGRKISRPSDVLKLPLIAIEWTSNYRPLPSWGQWAESIGAGSEDVTHSLGFSLSSSAIDAALAGHGVVLAQLAMVANDIQAGRLAIPFDRRLPLAEPYFVAWDRAALAKPFGMEFRAWLIDLATRQGALSRVESRSPGA